MHLHAQMDRDEQTNRQADTDAVMHMYLHVNMQACILAHMGDIPPDVDLATHFHGRMCVCMPVCM